MDIGTLNHTHRCFICGDTHLPLERYQYYSYEGRTVLLCYSCMDMQKIQKKEVEIMEDKPICWRCHLAILSDEETKVGLCEDCLDDFRTIRRAVLLGSAFLTWITGLIVCTTISLTATTSYLAVNVLMACLYLVWSNGWFGWINYLAEEYRKGKLK